MNKLVFNIVSVVKDDKDFRYDTLRENLVPERDFIISRAYRLEGVDYNHICTLFDFDKNVCNIYVTPIKPSEK